MDKYIFDIRRNYALWMKVEITKNRIRQWVSEYGIDGVYVSFSGGKDSTVLLTIARELYPEIKALYVDTGLEYPEVKQFVKTWDNVDIVRPKMNFREVLNNYGYPVISKEQSQYIYDYRNTNSEKLKKIRLEGNKWGRGKISKKWLYMIDAPFKISDKCCNVMKKAPAKNYEKETDRMPIVGTLAEESSLRMTHYLKEGCNAFDSKRPKSTPLGFWTNQDILQYIKENNIKIPSVYGEIVEDNGTLKTTGCDRTGCIYCAYGCHLEEENRFLRLEQTHPKLHQYCMENLGMKDVLEYMNISYTNKQKTVKEKTKLGNTEVEQFKWII
jgi:3'-phosphoadenosine 5'-phosphosulfate sulfotransferase (PAPS reductase)/FAD synthetase